MVGDDNDVGANVTTVGMPPAQFVARTVSIDIRDGEEAVVDEDDGEVAAAAAETGEATAPLTVMVVAAEICVWKFLWARSITNHD